MAILHDAKHREPILHGSAYIRMVKIGEIEYHLSARSSSLSAKKVESFKIIRKIGDLAYELELPSHIKIHNVIFVKHLEQANHDALQRDVPQSPSIQHKGEELYVIERVVRRERKDDEPGYTNNSGSSPIARTKRGRDTSVVSTQSAIKKRGSLLSQSSLSIDDDEAKPISISHRYPMPIWIAQTIITPYRVEPNAKSIEKDFYKHGMPLYTKYNIKVDDILANVALSDSHVQKILEVDLANSKKWPVDFANDQKIRVSRENREKAAKFRKTPKGKWKYHEVANYWLLGDEGRSSSIAKKSNLGEEHLLCVRQDDMDPLDEAVMGKEIEEREKKAKALTQSKKDVAARNLKEQIVVKFQHFTIANKDKRTIVVDENDERFTINTIIVDGDDAKSKSSYLFMLQIEIRNREAIQDLSTSDRVFIVNENDDWDANEDLSIDNSLFANPYLTEDDLASAQRLFLELKGKFPLFGLHRSWMLGSPTLRAPLIANIDTLDERYSYSTTRQLQMPMANMSPPISPKGSTSALNRDVRGKEQAFNEEK